jgi:hypothetical protein
MSRKAAQRTTRRAGCSQRPMRSKGWTSSYPRPFDGRKADGNGPLCASLRFSMTWRWAIVGCALVACSSRIPHPSYTARSTTELVEADYPPPPARVEFVPEAPSGDAVWLNGEWSWTGRRWGWKPGGWVSPPKGAAYSRGAVVRRQDGKLFTSTSRWQGPDGGEIPAPPFLRGSSGKSSSVVDPEGDPAPTAGDLQSDGGTATSPRTNDGTVDASTGAMPDAGALDTDAGR